MLALLLLRIAFHGFKGRHPIPLQLYRINLSFLRELAEVCLGVRCMLRSFGQGHKRLFFFGWEQCIKINIHGTQHSLSDEIHQRPGAHGSIYFCHSSG